MVIIYIQCKAVSYSWVNECVESDNFRQDFLTVGPVNAGDLKEIGVERLVKHLHVVPLEQNGNKKKGADESQW